MDGSVEALRCLVSLEGLNRAAEVVGTEPHVLLGHMLEDLEMLRVRLPRLINMIDHMTRKQPFSFKGMNTIGFYVSKHGTCAEQVVSLVDRVGIENTVNYHLKNEITRAELVHYIMRVKAQTTSLISDLEATIQSCFDRKNTVGYTHLKQDDLLVVFVKKRIDLGPMLWYEEDEYSKFEDLLNVLGDLEDQEQMKMNENVVKEEVHDKDV